MGWLSRPRRRGRTNALSLNLQNIPAAASLHVTVTQAAGALAQRYQRVLMQRFNRKKFPKAWLQQQLYAAQNILNKCDGDVELAASMIGHALSTQAHVKRSSKSMYNMFARWPRIEKSYSESIYTSRPYDTAKSTRTNHRVQTS